MAPLASTVDASERYDLDALTALLHEDVVQSMPPCPMWLPGHDEIRGCYLGTGTGQGSRLVPTVPGGAPAFGHDRTDPGGVHARARCRCSRSPMG